jgi:hypothetical protein
MTIRYPRRVAGVGGRQALPRLWRGERRLALRRRLEHEAFRPFIRDVRAPQLGGQPKQLVIARALGHARQAPRDI